MKPSVTNKTSMEKLLLDDFYSPDQVNLIRHLLSLQLAKVVKQQEVYTTYLVIRNGNRWAVAEAETRGAQLYLGPHLQ